jgi:hypothetical protein
MENIKMLRSALLATLLSTSLAASADDVENQIRLGLEAYQGKDYRAAVDELNYAVVQIQEKLNAQNSTLLPDALEGWTASEVENASAGMAMMGGGTHMSRSYQRGSESLEIAVTAGSPMVGAALAMINSPMLLGSSPDLKPFRYKRLKGMKQTSDRRVEITLSLAGQIMVQLTASNLSDENTVTRYLDAMDFDRIRSSLLQ